MSDMEGEEHHGTTQAAENGRRMSDMELGEHDGTHQAADADSAAGGLPLTMSPLRSLNPPPGRLSICPCREANSPLPAEESVQLSA